MIVCSLSLSLILSLPLSLFLPLKPTCFAQNTYNGSYQMEVKRYDVYLSNKDI